MPPSELPVSQSAPGDRIQTPDGEVTVVSHAEDHTIVRGSDGKFGSIPKETPVTTNGGQNAGPIPGNQGGVVAQGEVNAGSQANSGGNIQQAPQVTPNVAQVAGGETVAPQPFKVTAEAKVNPDAIPKDLQVDVKGVRAKTGEEVTIKQNAREALAEHDSLAERYKSLLECLRA